MTFEEFFTKKKINLVQLEKADPSLFAEFKSHFTLMGEKSFDHTKKFWFNKLRRQYHLSAPEKTTTSVENTIAAQAEPLSSPTIEQKVADTPVAIDPISPKPSAKPAFRPRNIPVKAEENKENAINQVSSAEQPSPVKKPGFKPRNIPSVNKEAEDIQSTESKTSIEATPETPLREVTPNKEDVEAKPAYKPKFNLKNLPKSSAALASDEIGVEKNPELPAAEGETAPTAEKPAYKPKFNLKNLPKVTPKEEISGTEKIDLEKNVKVEKEIAKSEFSEDTEANKPVYKPQFNMKNLPKAVQKEGGEQQNEMASESQTEDIKTLPESEKITENAAEVSPKPVYKPKFNMRNLPKATQQEGAEKEEDFPSADEIKETKEALVISESVTEGSDEPVAKPVYKPRFNMKNLPKVKQDEEQATAQKSNPIEVDKKSTDQSNNASEVPQEEPTVAPKPAFKPKFGLRNITPNPPEE